MALTIRVAMLNADTPVPNVLADRGSYGAMFHRLLSAAARRVSSPALPVTIEAADFDVVHGEYPASPADWDALVISGSIVASYDNEPWIYRLDQYLQDVYRDHPHLRIFGSCFGHQIICQSLLREHGVRVEKDPKGLEVGVHEIQLTDAFAKALGGGKTGVESSKGPSIGGLDGLPTPDADTENTQPQLPDSLPKQTLRLQFVHSDHVKLPSTAEGQEEATGGLPPSWMSMGRSQHCAVQGVYQPGRVLTYQGHFEFDRFVNSETVKTFFAKWEPAAMQTALDAIDKDDDAEGAADMVVRFLLEGRQMAEQGDGGLLTPPLKT